VIRHPTGCGEKSAERLVQRNGHRERVWEKRRGAAIAKARLSTLAGIVNGSGAGGPSESGGRRLLAG
jgi:hypothetical protein